MDHFLAFFPAICTGLGLFLVGVVNLALARCRARTRVAGTLASIGIALAAAAAINEGNTLRLTAQYLAIGLLPFVLFSSRKLASGAAWMFTAFHRPALRYGLVTVAGLGAVLGSIIVYERQDESASLEVLAELEMLHARGPVVPVERVAASTDRGTKIGLKEPSGSRATDKLSEVETNYLRNSQLAQQVIRQSGPNDRTNCHGWVFTGGEFLVGGEDVSVILSENGYQKTPTPRPGDLAIYRDGSNVTHSAIVRYVADGRPVLVEGKWGNLGVFLHPVEKSPYGADVTYYRSARSGHLIAGAGQSGPNSTTANGVSE